jgi:uncharacterized membrane protein YeaQ/YmgE (transglycosylase-associated protein family)
LRLAAVSLEALACGAAMRVRLMWRSRLVPALAPDVDPRAIAGVSSPAVQARSLQWPGAKEDAMSIVAWIVLGLIAGFIGSKIVNRGGEGLLLDIVLGVVGAVVGGFLFNLVGASGVTGLNVWSILVAVVGSIVVLVTYHALIGRRALA